MDDDHKKDHCKKSEYQNLAAAAEILKGMGVKKLPAVVPAIYIPCGEIPVKEYKADEVTSGEIPLWDIAEIEIAQKQRDLPNASDKPALKNPLGR